MGTEAERVRSPYWERRRERDLLISSMASEAVANVAPLAGDVAAIAPLGGDVAASAAKKHTPLAAKITERRA
jgi:hypothetical protein